MEKGTLLSISYPDKDLAAVSPHLTRPISHNNYSHILIHRIADRIVLLEKAVSTRIPRNVIYAVTLLLLLSGLTCRVGGGAIHPDPSCAGCYHFCTLPGNTAR